MAHDRKASWRPYPRVGAAIGSRHDVPRRAGCCRVAKAGAPAALGKDIRAALRAYSRYAVVVVWPEAATGWRLTSEVPIQAKTLCLSCETMSVSRRCEHQYAALLSVTRSSLLLQLLQYPATIMMCDMKVALTTPKLESIPWTLNPLSQPCIVYPTPCT